MTPKTTPKMQRAFGHARIAFDCSTDRQRLSDLYQSGCLKLMMPRVYGDVQEAVLINTAGGLTGGDRLELGVRLGDKAQMRLATQTAERIYRSASGDARFAAHFHIGSGTVMDWLPQETILFDGGRIKRNLSVEMEATASFLCVEVVVLGRSAMNEHVTSGLLHDCWRIRRGDRLVFADDLHLDCFAELKSPAALGDNIALATLLLVDQNSDRYKATLNSLLVDSELKGGVSCWNQLLLVRFLSQDAFYLRKVVMGAISRVRQGALPRVWTI